MSERKRLSDILSNGNAKGSGAGWVNDDWGSIPAAPDFGTPVPKNYYTTHIIEGAIFSAGTGTAGYKVTHEILEGDYKGRRLWHDIWLTETNKGGAVRDLTKLGITNKQQLDEPIPSRRIRCKVLVVIRQDDKGIDRNEVRSFEVLGVDAPPPADPFAPADDDALKNGKPTVSSEEGQS